MNREEASKLLGEMRTDVLLRVLPYEERGSFPYGLSEVERALIDSASPADWQRARTWLASERFLIECQFRTLADLLAVTARNPGRVPLSATVARLPAVASDPGASRWSRLVRLLRRRRRTAPAVTPADPVATDAARWGVPVEDFRTAVLALDALGWLKAAA